MFVATSCAREEPPAAVEAPAQAVPRPEIYADFELTADLSHLTDDQRDMIGLLIEASEIMDGPWDRLDDDKPFIKGVAAKPLGARFYPADMSKEEFDEAYLPGKTGQYSFIRRDADGALELVPYHVAYAAELGRAAGLLRQARGKHGLCQFSETTCGGTHQR